jgi:hypothetical protein
MRLAEQEKGFVKNTRIRISGEKTSLLGENGVAREYDTLETIPYDIINAARNISGSVLYDDFVPVPPGDAWSMNEWAGLWPRLQGDDTLEVFNAVDRRAAHLLWVAARFSRRYC